MMKYFSHDLCMECGRLNHMPHRGVHVLIPRTCEFVILHGEKDVADKIKLRMGRLFFIIWVGLM